MRNLSALTLVITVTSFFIPTFAMDNAYIEAQHDSIMENVAFSCDSILTDSDACAKEFKRDSILSLSHSGEVTLYDLPYSRKLSLPNKHNLLQNTLALYGGGVVALGVLELLPEDATAWNKEKLRKTPFFKRWWNHVKKGPVWDHDKWYFNYLLHPYGGAAYYMSARSQGCNMRQSLVYAVAVSTIFWEYGIEAFMEYPSIQDLVITPITGSIIGEGFYRLKRHIVSQNYYLNGSKVLGKIVAFLVDPVNEFMSLFRHDSPRMSYCSCNFTFNSSKSVSLVINF